MLQILDAFVVWLHSLATIIFIGHYLLLALITLPALAKNGFDNAKGMFLSEISKHSRLWMYASLLTLAGSGVYLTLADSNYLGLGNFGNPWGILMLVKHLLIVGMIVLGFWFNAVWRVGPQMASNTGASLGLKRFRLFVNLMAISGALVLLLTAIAQFE